MFFLIEKHMIETKKINHNLLNSLATASICSTGTYDAPCMMFFQNSIYLGNCKTISDLLFRKSAKKGKQFLPCAILTPRSKKDRHERSQLFENFLPTFFRSVHVIKIRVPIYGNIDFSFEWVRLHSMCKETCVIFNISGRFLIV